MRANRYILLVIAVSLVSLTSMQDIFSQGTDLFRSKNPKLFLGISLQPVQSNINYSGTSAITSAKTSGNLTFSGSLDAGYYFSRFIGLSIGIGYNSFSNELDLVQYESKFQDTDTDMESYEMRVSGSDIKEELGLGFLSIPVNLLLRVPVNDKIGLFVEPGIGISVPVRNSYKNSGKFSYKGYYAAYNVLFENLPDFGFPSNLSSSSEGNVETSQVCFNGLVSCGMDFFVGEKIQIAVGGTYSKSLSNISGYTSVEKYQLSSSVDELNSLMGAYTRTEVSAYGISVRLRYFFK